MTSLSRNFCSSLSTWIGGRSNQFWCEKSNGPFVIKHKKWLSDATNGWAVSHNGIIWHQPIFTNHLKKVTVLLKSAQKQFIFNYNSNIIIVCIINTRLPNVTVSTKNYVNICCQNLNDLGANHMVHVQCLPVPWRRFQSCRSSAGESVATRQPRGP